MPAKITFFFEKRKHFLKKSFIRCPIFQFHTSIECKGYENRRIQPYHPTDAQQLESVRPVARRYHETLLFQKIEATFSYRNPLNKNKKQHKI
jgi:hypothetical protein